jgi:hypothetical protein
MSHAGAEQASASSLAAAGGRARARTPAPLLRCLASGRAASRQLQNAAEASSGQRARAMRGLRDAARERAIHKLGRPPAHGQKRHVPVCTWRAAAAYTWPPTASRLPVLQHCLSPQPCHAASFGPRSQRPQAARHASSMYPGLVTHSSLSAQYAHLAGALFRRGTDTAAVCHGCTNAPRSCTPSVTWLPAMRHQVLVVAATHSLCLSTQPGVAGGVDGGA